jgi:hypothetical protein
MYALRPPRSDLPALTFTLTAGLIVPALVLLWITGGLPSRAVPVEDPRSAPETPVIATPPLASELGSRLVSQAAPAAILLHGLATVTMTYENTGSVAWVRGSASEVRLGVFGDDRELAERGFAHDWPLITRVAIQQEAVVGPGQHATFVFRIRGARAGLVRIPLRPVVDGVSWLNAEVVYVEIIVGAISAPAPRPSPA